MQHSTKTIYLIRHGMTIDGENITPPGETELRQSGERIRTELGDLISVTVYHSPLKRAVKSAEILAEALKPITTELVSRPELTCDNYGVGSVVETVEQMGILVSHMPDLEKYALSLTGRYIRFRNAEYHKFEI